MIARRPFFILGILLIATTLTACGTENALRQDPERITQAEIQSSSTLYPDAYMLVQRLRPLWLHRRGPHSLTNHGDIRIYVDDFPYGSLDALRRIHPENVTSLRFLPPERATFRYGGGHPHGAIIIRTKDGPER